MNKIKVYTGCLLWLIALVSFGQTSKQYEKYSSKYNYQPGYIITNRGVRIEGVIKDLTGEMQKHARVVFVPKEGVKNTYHPSGISEYGSDYKRYVSNGSKFFEVILESNTITMYKLRYASGGGYGTNMPSTRASSYYFKRGSEVKFTEVGGMGFRKRLRKYFSDCPVLQNKIANKELTRKDAREIMRIYQNQCAR
jgi:hypothetical protein